MSLTHDGRGAALLRGWGRRAGRSGRARRRAQRGPNEDAFDSALSVPTEAAAGSPPSEKESVDLSNKPKGGGHERSARLPLHGAAVDGDGRV